MTIPGEGVVITSSGSATALAARETAGPDTFALYGGPDEFTEGKFQMASGVTPDWGDGFGSPAGYGGDPALAWRPVDLSIDQPTYWHRSQFNAQTLGTTQPSPNHAMWSGVEAGDPLAEGWVAAPGYGNGWNDILVYESDPLAYPRVGQDVSLDFFFHYDVESGYDYFLVEYDSAGTWTEVLAMTGSASDPWGTFDAPGTPFSGVQRRPIRFMGDDYGGASRDRIRIRLRVESDGTCSNEDGLWPSTAGAAQVDEITLVTSQGTFTEDFETIPVPPERYLFHPLDQPFAGDFADVYARMSDIDPCRDNPTPVLGFIDYNQVVRNGPGVYGDIQTGGSTSAGVNYGIEGNYVCNYNGGLSFGDVSLYNEIWSPDILWDLEGTEDDGTDIAGAFIRFSVWEHLPLENGYCYVWRVRSARSGENYGEWRDRGLLYFGEQAGWRDLRFDVSDLIQPGSERVQLALGARDLADVLRLPGTAATPSPAFDNVAFYKYRVGGPALATRVIDLANDGFPVSRSIDVSSPATRNSLDVPFDMARDVNSGDLFNVPGDSVIVDVATIIPGTFVTDIRMVWALQTNDVFEDALRAAPDRAKDVNVVAGAAGTVWSGEVIADTSRTSWGAVVENRYYVDLPDVDFMYPGDILHYYIQATDSDGRTTTLPHDTTDFLVFGVDAQGQRTRFDRAWTVRALPAISDRSGAQPEILVYNDFGRRGGEDEWVGAFDALGYAEGVDYDSYTVQGPTAGVSNGLGSPGAHGAALSQISGYRHIFYFAGDLGDLLLSNGDPDLPGNDKSDDIGLLEQWHLLEGRRNIAYFGDNVASATTGASTEGRDYVAEMMGVEVVDADVRPRIGDQTAPRVVPAAVAGPGSHFLTQFVASGGCPVLNTFDWIRPQPILADSYYLHRFTEASTGIPIFGPAASVIRERSNGYDVTFPFGFESIVLDLNPQRAPVSIPVRASLLQELLNLFAAPAGGSPIVSAPKAAKVELLVRPNPFNPSTRVTYTAPTGAQGSVRVYNLRGELVRTLFEGMFSDQVFDWDGTDDRGSPVASGVYIVHAQADGQSKTRKAALVR